MIHYAPRNSRLRILRGRFRRWLDRRITIRWKS